MSRQPSPDFIRPEPGAPPAEPTLAAGRYTSLDVARGVIMIIMALDHASMTWNAGRPKPFCLEGAVGLPMVEYGNVLQQITREVTHICAPGFQFLAGMGLAISVWRRERRGVSQLSITGDMVLRGLVLCFCDFVLMYYVYGQIPLLFVVLACIGCSIIAFSVLRKLPLAVIALLSAVVILAGPLYAQDEAVQPSLSAYPVNILFNIVIGSPPRYWVIYPVLPWIGCFGLGWCLGRLYERGRMPTGRAVAVTGGAMVIAAFFLRWFGGGYADRLPLAGGPTSASFRMIAKYPPSPVFMLSTIGAMGLMLGALRRLDHQDRLAGLWKIPITYGRVALFFYMIHFYVYGIYPTLAATLNQYSLATTYLVWLAGLAVLLPPCIFYHRLRTRYRRFLRYF